VPSTEEPGATTAIANRRARLQDFVDKIPLYEHLGVVIEDTGEVVRCAVPLTPESANHLDAMHAGVTFTTVEMVGGVAVLARPELADGWLVVRRVDITYTKVARTAVRAETTFDDQLLAGVLAQLDTTGKADFRLEITALDDDGETVATATGHYHLRLSGSRGT
jgi:acyl-coenzyme A thioesterase PaaI-like protein